MTLEMLNELFWWVGAILSAVGAILAASSLGLAMLVLLLKQLRVWGLMFDFIRCRKIFKEWVRMQNQTKQR